VTCRFPPNPSCTPHRSSQGHTLFSRRLFNFKGLTPITFEDVYILWASLVGYLIFADMPGPRTMIGGAVIVVSGCYIILRERK